MAHKELLLEIGCEEIPAGWLPALTTDLADRMGARLEEHRLGVRGAVVAVTGPRRLAVRVAGVSERQRDLAETVTGPPVSVAIGPDGRPTRAAEGFAAKQGVAVTRLISVATPRGEYLAVERRQRGAAARRVLPAVLAGLLRSLAFPKRMHWDAWLDDGHGALPFGRPIRWLLFLYGGQVVPFIIERTDAARASGVRPVKAGAVTYGHRFFARVGKAGRPIRVRTFAEYRAKLSSAYVIIEHAKRRDRITRKLDACATRVGGRVVLSGQPSTLLDEVPDLVEYPSVVTGTFPSEFLELPDEVLRTTMIHHQHYFPVASTRGRLKPHFLAVTNTPRDNVTRIARNAEWVLVARLRDARFFWDADRRTRLEDRLDRLDTLLFHKKLGSYSAKTERVADLAERIAREALGASEETAVHARRAGRLAKADLATDMVGEFPELQGIMGGVYAREQGEPDEVWKAVYHHYLPVGVEADAPPSRRDLGAAAVTWAALSLADKLDTLVGLFHAGEKPTGSRDPLGMRRQAQGLLRILVDLPELTGLEVRPTLDEVVTPAEAVHQAEKSSDEEELARLLHFWDFLTERLRYVLEARGYDVRNVRAVTHGRLHALRPLDVRRKLEVLPDFAETPDFRDLAQLFKRVRNIAKELDDQQFDLAESTSWPIDQFLKHPSEKALFKEMTARTPIIEAAVATGDNYRRAFAEASKFGPAVARFFDDVLVMTDDMRVRQARLRLLKRLERLVLQLADVSEIVREDKST